LRKQSPRRISMKTPTEVTAPNALRATAAKLAIALVLAATPLMAIGFAALGDAPVTLAGSSYPDDIDPG
jgi:hypothetical protein